MPCSCSAEAGYPTVPAAQAVRGWAAAGAHSRDLAVVEVVAASKNPKAIVSGAGRFVREDKARRLGRRGSVLLAGIRAVLEKAGLAEERRSSLGAQRERPGEAQKTGGCRRESRSDRWRVLAVRNFVGVLRKVSFPVVGDSLRWEVRAWGFAAEGAAVQAEP